MNIRRLPIALLAVGLVFKTFLLTLWRFWKPVAVMNLLINYDPGARYFAEKITHLFFDYGGITFAPGANACYEVSLVIGFGMECLLAGFLLRWLLGRFQDQRPNEGLPGAYSPR